MGICRRTADDDTRLVALLGGYWRGIFHLFPGCSKKLGSLEAWKLGSLEAWKPGSLEASSLAPHDG
ncbi:hypothetical protein MY3957_000348 [Beauveria namnaoensis]